jgi:hypothetical protein
MKRLAEMEMMISYVRAKIAWLTRGKQGRRPHFGSYMRRDSRINVEQTDSAEEGTRARSRLRRDVHPSLGYQRFPQP